MSLVLSACGEKDPPMMQLQIDAPASTGCTGEADCSAPTPYCEPSTSTCVQCRFSSHCTATNGVCEQQACRAARSCAELKAELPGLASGIYPVDIDGDGETAPENLYCDMAVDGGGWALVQRTRWQWSQNQALKTTFAVWHDSTIGSPAIGAAYRLAGQHWPALAAQGDIMVTHRMRTTAGGACAPLYYIGTGGTLTVDSAAKSAQFANLVQPANLINSSTLSTADSGSDSDLCVNTNNAVPWFYGSCCSTCPTYQGGYWSDEPHPMVAYTDTVADVFGNREVEACAGQTPQPAVAGAHRGVDTMEIYLR